MNNQCPQCGNPLKLVPAGVSRISGRLYNAFYACTNPSRTCTFKQPVQAQGVPLRAMNNLQTKTNEQKDLEKSTGMVRHGFAIESFKMGMKLDPITARTITNWTNFVMTGKLFTDPVIAPTPQPEQLPTINVEEPGSEEINVTAIPF